MGVLTGIRPLDEHLAGEHLTRRRAMQAKCAECMNRYVDGARDCGVPGCPLYPWMPYGKADATAGEAPKQALSSTDLPLAGSAAGPSPAGSPQPE